MTEAKILDMLIDFAKMSEAEDMDPFLSRPAVDNYPRKCMTSRMLGEAIKSVAVKMNLDPTRYSTKSFKMAAITWMIQAGVSQHAVNKAMNHSQKGSSSFHYQDVNTALNPFAIIGETNFSLQTQASGNAFRGSQSRQQGSLPMGGVGIINSV